MSQSIKRATNFFLYQIHVFYSPDPPVEDCPLRLLIKFISKYDDTAFLNQVQYDFWVVDVDSEGKPLTPPLRSLADEDGRLYLYSPSGQSELEFTVSESGTANYLLYIYGLSPENIVPPVNERDFLLLPLEVHPRTPADPSPPQPADGTESAIPDWIKTTALWWAEGEINDDSFLQGLQFLIREGILVVPQTDTDAGADPGPIRRLDQDHRPVVGRG